MRDTSNSGRPFDSNVAALSTITADVFASFFGINGTATVRLIESNIQSIDFCQAGGMGNRAPQWVKYPVIPPKSGPAGLKGHA